MSEEQQQASAAPQSGESQTVTQAPAQEPSATQNEPSLDDVISEYSAQPVQQSPQPSYQPEPQRQGYQQNGFDPNDLSQLFGQEQSQLSALTSQVQALTNQLTLQEQRREQDLVTADIKNAVNTVSKKVEGLEPDFVEFYLEKKASESPGFKQIWDNRKANPAALAKALGAISNEMAQKYTFRTDPQLAENQRAAKTSQQSSASRAESEFHNSLEEKLANAKTSAEFSKIWAAAKRGG